MKRKALLKKISVVIAVTVLCLSTMGAAPGYAETGGEKDLSVNGRDMSIRLKAVEFDPAVSVPRGEPAGLFLRGYATGSGDYIVQFNGPVSDECKESLTDLGAKLFCSVPNYAFIVRMDDDTRQQVEALPFVRWVGIYQPAYKISPGLLEVTEAKQAAILLSIALFDTDESLVISEIRALGGEAVVVSPGRIRASIDSSKVTELASVDGVVWIEEYIMLELCNDVSAQIMNVDPIVWDTHGLNGTGQIVAVADTGLDTGVDDTSMHDDFGGRVVNITSWPVEWPWWYGISNSGADDGAADLDSGHGTHVAGSVLGNGTRSGGNITGIAPGASLVFQALEQWIDYVIGTDEYKLAGIPDDLNDLFQQAYDDGARIHTNSWGAPVGGQYNEHSEQADQFIWNHKDMTMLFSAGNEGIDGNGDGIVDDDSIGAPGTAKNVITVGASENNRPAMTPTYGAWWPTGFPANPVNSDPMADDSDGMVAFSSRGPCEDVRIKPDVVAPGTWVLSTRSSLATGTRWGLLPVGDPNRPFYMYMGGTSMATPLTAGACALIRQYYMEERSHTPNASLIKATLINGAFDMPGQYAPDETGATPNNNEGWGRVDLANSIFPEPPNVLCFSDSEFSLSTGDTRYFCYNVTDNTTPLKITLVWTDFPGAAPAGGLVNDLDLYVRSPSGDGYLGNDFTAPYDDTFDEVNNVEQVRIGLPENGVYQVIVHGYWIAQGPQDFSIVITGGVEEITCVQTVAILSPTQASPIFAGPYDSPNHISVQVGAKSVDYTPLSGLTKDDFGVQIGGKPASFTLSELTPGRYHLDVLPPEQDAEGLYDLEVTLLNAISDIEPQAVRHGGPGKNVDVVLIIDRSGSMDYNHDYPPYTNRMEAAKAAANDFLDLVVNGDRAALVPFESSAWVEVGLTEDIGVVRNAVNQLYGSGMTAMGEAIYAGVDEIGAYGDPSHGWGMILLTDGYWNEGRDPRQAAQYAAGKGIPIYTIGIGDRASGEFDENVLIDIAGTTGVEYQYAKEALDLQRIYAAMSGTLRGETGVKSATGTVEQGATDTLKIWLDPSIEKVRLIVNWAGSDVDAYLYYPDGSLADPAVDPNIEYSGSDAKPEWYIITSPEAGEWTMGVYGVDVPVGGEDYQFTASAETTLTLRVGTDESLVDVNEPVKIIASIMAGSDPITGAYVSADITRPDDTTDTLTLEDRGNGIYEAYYDETDLEGGYIVRVVAERTGEFTREAGTQFRAEEATLPIAVSPGSLAADISQGEETQATFTVNIDQSAQALASGEFQSIVEEALGHGNATSAPLSSNPDATVAIEGTTLSDGEGNTIPQDAWHFYPNLLTITPGDSDTFDAYLAAPTDTPLGTYRGSVVLASNVGNARVDVEITVANSVPVLPSNPSPSNHATCVRANADLSWAGGDPDAGDTVTYDVFVTSATPPSVSNGQSTTTYDPGTLACATKYYWQIVVTDNHGATTTGPLWEFTTELLRGDANQDGVTNTGDITKVKRIYFEMDAPIDCADVNGDGRIDTGDITAIRLIYFGAST